MIEWVTGMGGEGEWEMGGRKKIVKCLSNMEIILLTLHP